MNREIYEIVEYKCMANAFNISSYGNGRILLTFRITGTFSVAVVCMCVWIDHIHAHTTQTHSYNEDISKS